MPWIIGEQQQPAQQQLVQEQTVQEQTVQEQLIAGKAAEAAAAGHKPTLVCDLQPGFNSRVALTACV